MIFPVREWLASLGLFWRDRPKSSDAALLPGAGPIGHAARCAPSLSPWFGEFRLDFFGRSFWQSV
jgi:hypothetical protein